MRESTLLEQSRTNDLAFSTARKDSFAQGRDRSHNLIKMKRCEDNNISQEVVKSERTR